MCAFALLLLAVRHEQARISALTVQYVAEAVLARPWPPVHSTFTQSRGDVFDTVEDPEVARRYGLIRSRRRPGTQLP